MTTTKDVTFTGATGNELAGELDLPDRTPRAVGLFAHCFTGGKDIAAATRISDGLTELGFAVLRFDFTGLGESEGDFADKTFSSNVGDLAKAADFLRDTLAAPALLVGHSLGGAAVLAAAERIPEVRAVATVAAPADPEHVTHLFEPKLDDIKRTGEARVMLAGRPFRIRQQFIDDIAAQPQQHRITNLDKPLLVMHSPSDQLVGIDNAARIFELARHPKSFVSLDDADHLLTRREDSHYVATVIAAWADRYLPDPGSTPSVS